MFEHIVTHNEFNGITTLSCPQHGFIAESSRFKYMSRKEYESLTKCTACWLEHLYKEKRKHKLPAIKATLAKKSNHIRRRRFLQSCR